MMNEQKANNNKSLEANRWQQASQQEDPPGSPPPPDAGLPPTKPPRGGWGAAARQPGSLGGGSPPEIKREVRGAAAASLEEASLEEASLRRPASSRGEEAFQRASYRALMKAPYNPFSATVRRARWWMEQSRALC